MVRNSDAIEPPPPEALAPIRPLSDEMISYIDGRSKITGDAFMQYVTDNGLDIDESLWTEKQRRELDRVMDAAVADYEAKNLPPIERRFAD